jgi:hypothetical protein
LIPGHCQRSTTLRGLRSVGLLDRPTLRWRGGSSGEGSKEPLVHGNSTFSLQNLQLLRVDMPNLAAVVSVGHGSQGARIVGVNASSLRSKPYTGGQQVNWTLFVGQATGFEIIGSHFKQDGPIEQDGAPLGPDPSPCKMGFPFRTVFHLDGSADGIVSNSSFEMGCEGWSMFSTRRVVVEGNLFVASPAGNVSEGGSITNSALPPSTKHNAVLRNRDVQSATAYYRYETFTSDGGCGGYEGRSVSSDGATVTLASAVTSRQSEWWPPPGRPMDTNWSAAAMVVLGGTGAGQIAELASSEDRTLRLTAELQTTLDTSSELTVVPFSGRSIIAGNVYTNGTSVDYYGTALELVFADNTLTNMRSRPCPHCGDGHQLQDPIGGICAHSLIYGSGKNAHMPNARVEILGNTLTDTNGITVMAANCGANSSVVQVSPRVPYAPLTLGFVVRRNLLRRTRPCDFAPHLALFQHNTRFYWDFDTSAGCAVCKTAVCADDTINVIGCVRGGVVEGNVVARAINVNATNGSRSVLALNNTQWQ